MVSELLFPRFSILVPWFLNSCSVVSQFLFPRFSSVAGLERRFCDWRREPMSEASFSGSGRLCWGCFAAWAGSFGVTGDHLGLPGEIKGGAWSHQKRFCWFHGEETMNSGGGLGA